MHLKSITREDKNYNKYLEIELKRAKVIVQSIPDSSGEIIIGKTGSWTLKRDYRYWAATVPETALGLPLEIASKMHEKKYPDEMFDEPVGV